MNKPVVATIVSLAVIGLLAAAVVIKGKQEREKSERAKRRIEKASELPQELPSILPGILTDNELVTTPSGLKYIDLEVGTGSTPSRIDPIVKVHYTGYLLDGTEFESTKGRSEAPRLGLNTTIAGWSEGIGSMRAGGRRKLVIPPELGYGSSGTNGIPGNATLVFDIELLRAD